jgi:hypothetical protein
VRRYLWLAFLFVCWPGVASAGGMDPTLSRLQQTVGKGGCLGRVCPDDEAFEQLASELAETLAPAIHTGANTDGARGFYVGLSSTFTPIRSDQRYWALGTRGNDPSAARNPAVDSTLNWNRLEVRKGLPFGFEIGSSLGFGTDTALWVLSAELRVSLFEGFHSGLGALPDVALRAGTQTLLGSSELAISTQAFDLTISKPFVIAQVHRLTPLLALQALIVSARSGRIDLTPSKNAFTTCLPEAPSAPGSVTCGAADGATELADNVRFRSLHQTRMRVFVGAEERYRMWSIAASFGIDVLVPGLRTEIAGSGLPSELMRQFSLHLAGGVRY